MNERGERVNVTGSRAAPTGPRIQNLASNVAGVLGPIVTGFLPARTPRTDGAIA